MEDIFKFKGTVGYNKESDRWFITDEKGKNHNAGSLLDGIDILNWDINTDINDIVEITVKRNSK
jgi:hypothetical protein